MMKLGLTLTFEEKIASLETRKIDGGWALPPLSFGKLATVGQVVRAGAGSIRYTLNLTRLNPFPSAEICMAAHLAVATARRP